MTDDMPPIYVDNRRLAPIERIRPPAARPVPPARGDERPFGIVDRVTISPQAREQLRRDAAAEDPGPAEPATLLTYTPRQLRDK